MNDGFEIEHREAVTVITLGGAVPGNALTLPALRELSSEIRSAGARPQTRVLRVRGWGDDFSIGRATEKPGPDAPKTAHEIRTQLVEPILAVYAALRELPFPVVAEVAGRATGLGCALVAACDVAIASRSARFSLPEMAKDLPPTLALSALGRKAGAKAASRLVYGLGELDAQGALIAGLVGEVVDDDALAAHVDAVCDRIASRNPVALLAIKRYLRAMHDGDAEAMAELAASVLSGAVSSIRSGVTER